MNSSLTPVRALGTLLLLLGIMLFNNSVATWQFSQQAYRQDYQNQAIQQEYRLTRMRQALYLASALFLMLLGIQIILRRRWACHFFFSIRQLSQLALLLIPLGTVLLLLNRPLVDSLVRIYQPIVQEVMQQQQQNVVLGEELMRRSIRVAFWILALLGMAIASLVLRLSGRCLRPEVRDALLECAPPPGRLSRFVLCLPRELLLLLPLSVYGTASQLLKIMLGFPAVGMSLLLNLLAFTSFALSLMQLTHRNMLREARMKFPLLKKALGFCSLAYILQLLQRSPLPDLGAELAAMKASANQLSSLGHFLLLLLLGLFYLSLRRLEQENRELAERTGSAPPEN